MLNAALARFPRLELVPSPTPLEKLERLSAHLGGAVEIYAKREDCNSGLAYGGNKLRKLEYIIPDAIAGGRQAARRRASSSSGTSSCSRRRTGISAPSSPPRQRP